MINFNCSFHFIKNQNVEHPDQLTISQQTLSPPDSQMPPLVLAILASLSRDYVYTLGKNFENVQAHLIISPKKGIMIKTSTDEKLKELITNKPLVKGRKKNSLSLVTVALQQYKINKTFEVDLKIFGINSLNTVSLTTGMLRFPHLLKDLFSEKNKFSKQPNICIVGPGLFKDPHPPASCPQFVEIFSLFPEAQFLLLDNNQEALEALQSQLIKCKMAIYDPLMLHLRLEDPSFKTPQSYQETFQTIKENLIDKAHTNDRSQVWPQDKNKIRKLALNINPQKIEVRNFDINTSLFNEGDKFHIIVATMSILIAITGQIQQDPHANVFNTISKFLEKLDEEGIFYMDASLIKIILEKIYGQEGIEIGFSWIEAKLGYRLVCTEISLVDFLSNGEQSNLLPCFSHQEFKLAMHNNAKYYISSSHLYKITKTKTPVEYSEEQKKDFEDQLIVLLNHSNN